MNLGEYRTVGGRRIPARAETGPDTATVFLAHTLANIAAWRGAEAAHTEDADLEVRLTPRELELVVRLLAADAGDDALALLRSLADDRGERVIRGSNAGGEGGYSGAGR